MCIFLIIIIIFATVTVTLLAMMLTVDFSLLGSRGADRLRSAAEFPCHVRLAADVCASYPNCEDKQVGRGRALLSGREGTVCAPQAVLSAEISLPAHNSYPRKPSCSCWLGFLSITSHRGQEAHVWWAK